MTRLLLLAVVAVLLYLLLRGAVTAFLAGFRGVVGPRSAPRAIRDELVKDPVCETYVPRRSAVARSVGATTHYFCSAACAEKFQRSA